MANFYLDDDEAREDWDAERAAFERPADAEDQLPLPLGVEDLPVRFWIDDVAGLPVVRDRLYRDEVVARFVTLKAAEGYAEARNIGVGHYYAMFASGEWPKRGSAA